MNIILFFALTGLAPLAIAESEAVPSTVAEGQLAAKVVTRTQPLLQWEVGIALGDPGVFNGNIGLWGNGKFPLVLRLSGGYVQVRSGRRAGGVDALIGYQYLLRSNLRAYLGAKATTSFNDLAESHRWTGLGPTFGIYFSGLHFGTTLSFGKGESAATPYELRTPHHRPQIHFQLGYSFLL